MNKEKQMSSVPEVVQQLRNLGVTEDKKLKLEYFFYTNSKGNAEGLAKHLAGRAYDAGFDIAVGDMSQFVITGWTSPMQMSNAVVVAWVGEMCDMGYEFDCEFDGWGTNPNQ